jgi:small-conductance mechanosensitive channel
LIASVIVALLLFLIAAPNAAVAQSALNGESSRAEETEGTPQPDTATPLATLLEILKDDSARAELISEPERTVSPDLKADETTVETVTTEAVSLGRRIALVTQRIGEETVSTLTDFWRSLTNGGSVFSGLGSADLQVLVDAIPGLLAVIFITVSAFLVLRFLARGFYARMGRKAENAGIIQSIALFVGSNLIDALIVIVAWAVGYIITILVVGDFGQIGIRQSMYLNAFLLVEMTKVVIRSFLSPIASGLRIVSVSDYAAAAMTRYLSFIVSVMGYGQLVVVPIVNQSASRAAASGVSAMIAALVLLYFVYIVLRRRKEVTNWLHTETVPVVVEGAETGASTEPSRGWISSLLRGLASIWHWFVLGYLAVMFIVVMTQPGETTLNALIGSGKILVAIIIAALISGWLAQAIRRGISLPEDLNAKLPLLERRINKFVPRAFGLLRLFLLICVLFFTLDVIGSIDLGSWLESQVGLAVTAAIFSVTLILLVSFGIWLGLTSFVDYKLNPEYGQVPTSRETTLLSLLRNAATIALIILTLMFVLSEVGLDIGPLLASAGVLGLAIGFGAQKMVQDIITGVFIQFENAINVGDVITVGGTTGTVEKLSVRSVSLRDVHGVFHMIPFSTVDMVSNYMREFAYFVCDMGIAYREDVDEAKQAMFDAFDLMIENEPDTAGSIMGGLEWFGLNSFGDSAVVLRARIKTIPGKQWGVGRVYNGYLKKVFDDRGIEIPFPQQTIWLGEAKDGTTQPFRLEDKTGRANKTSSETRTAPIPADDVPDSEESEGADER